MTESDRLENISRLTEEELMCTMHSDDESSTEGESNDSAGCASAGARPLSPRLGKRDSPARSRAATTGSLAHRQSPPRRTRRSNSTCDEMENNMESGDLPIFSTAHRRTSLPLEVRSEMTPPRRSQSVLPISSDALATPVTSSSCFFSRLMPSCRFVLSAGACLVLLSVFCNESVATVMLSPVHTLAVSRRNRPRTSTVSVIDGGTVGDAHGQEVTFHGLAMEFAKDDDDGAVSAASSRDTVSIESFKLATPASKDQNPSVTSDNAREPSPETSSLASQGIKKRRPRQPVLSYARSSSTSHPPRQSFDDLTAPSSPTTNKVRGEPYVHHSSLLGPSGKTKVKVVEEFHLEVAVADATEGEFHPFLDTQGPHPDGGQSMLLSTVLICVWLCVTAILLDGFLREVLRRLSNRHQHTASPGRVLRYPMSSTSPWSNRRHLSGHVDARTM